MKLPKFIKTSATRASERQQNLQKSNRQLLLSELNFQPHKNAAAIMNFDKTLYMTPNRELYQLKATSNQKLVSNSNNNNSNGRYVKSAQPKRLQRTQRGHAGGGSYATRSVAFAGGNISYKLDLDISGLMPASKSQTTTTNALTTPLVFRTMENGRKLSTANLDEVDDEEEEEEEQKKKHQETLTPKASPKNPNNHDQIDSQHHHYTNDTTNTHENTYQVPETPSRPQSNNPLDTALVETPVIANSNRFSFSKLTKFVSKSALKVISHRKMSASPQQQQKIAQAPPSPPTSPDSSTDSIATLSPTTSTTDEEHQSKKACQHQQQHVTVYTDLDVEIYRCEEQRRAIESKLKELKRCAQMQNRLVPKMGVTSVILRQLRRGERRGGFSATTGCVPSACLVATPYVFPPSNYRLFDVKEEKEVDVESEEEEDEEEERPMYDRLSRVPFLGEDVVTTKKSNARPVIVKSLSSLVNKSPQKGDSNGSGGQQQQQQNSSCRITVFSGKKFNTYSSIGRLAHHLTVASSSSATTHKAVPVIQQSHYESFSETVF